MKTLIVNDVRYEAERIIKKDDSIVGHNGDIVVFNFSGISDFSGFTLLDDAEFDVPQKTEAELLREENEQLRSSLADLWEVVLLGGAE